MDSYKEFLLKKQPTAVPISLKEIDNGFETLEEGTRSKATGIFIGRMQPPTVLHQKIVMDGLKKYSKMYIFIVEGKQSGQDPKNFLSFNYRKKLLAKCMPGVTPILAETGYIPDIIENNKIDTTNGVAIIAGSDRIDSYMRQLSKAEYTVTKDEIKRDPANSVSATRVRNSLKDGNYQEYRILIAKGLEDKRTFGFLRELYLEKNPIKENELFKVFQEKLLFEAEGKNLHQIHLEQMALMGVDELRKAIEISQDLRDKLAGKGTKSKSNVTIKWDGAPAVFTGQHPETKKFFIATKGLFNKDPKIMYTKEDIANYYPGGGGLAEKLYACMEYFPSLNIKGILQGDLMFTDDKKTESIDGKSYYTFRPNTITYAVETSSPLGKQIGKAKIGVVFHTKYSGNTIETLSPSFDVNLSSLTQNPNVWVSDAYHKNQTGHLYFSGAEYDKATKMLSEIGKTFKKIKRTTYEGLRAGDLFDRMEVYNNVLVKEGRLASPAGYLRGFTKYYTDFWKGIIDKLKTEKGKEGKRAKMQEGLNWLKAHKDEVGSMIYIYKLLTELKIMFVRKFEDIEQHVDTFVEMPTGYQSTKPEGFCWVKDGEIVKLVDRLTFSKNNFTIAKNWTK